LLGEGGRQWKKSAGHGREGHVSGKSSGWGEGPGRHQKKTADLAWHEKERLGQKWVDLLDQNVETSTSRRNEGGGGKQPIREKTDKMRETWEGQGKEF